MKNITSAAVACVVAIAGFAAIDAHAMSSGSPLAASAAATVASTGDSPILLARRGADNPPGDARRGRGADDPAAHKRNGADNLPGDMRRRSGRDDSATHKRQGADDPAGDVRRGRGRDDPPNHG